MKLPRWLVIGMWTSIVLAVLVAVGWWWVTWPERTMTAFIEKEIAWETGDRQVDGDVAGWVRGAIREHDDLRLPLNPSDWQPEPRTLRDILIARQEFTGPYEMKFVAERGSVSGTGHPSSMLYFILRRAALSSDEPLPDPTP